ncbi:MAG TPA: serine hydrolase [Calditrichia bacterium]|nr:serine hydrolase [Calditrichia bacterium]
MSLVVMMGFAVLLAAGCEKALQLPEDPGNKLVEILRAHHRDFRPVLEDPQRYRLQILYTQIDRDSSQIPHFTQYGLFLDDPRYFYPASSVKLPAAMLALEKLNKLNLENVNKFTSLRIDSVAPGQSTVWADSTAADGLPSIGHYIRKILVVSDNDAFNRLYEFLGQAYLREALLVKGYQDSWIIRRLESGMGPEANRITNAFTFYGGENLFYDQPAATNPATFAIDMPDVRQGKGVMRNGELIGEPIDFSHSNYISVRDLQDYVRAIFFPESFPEERRFDLTEEDRLFLIRYMGCRPRESGIAAYADTSEYYDSYVKFFLYGDTRRPMPDNVRIFSKSGQAYGYLIDNAYIVDWDSGVEFLLTAVLQVNDNQIYNDNHYEYREIGIPFMARLGQHLYDYEKSRPRAVQPDLSQWNVFE